MIPKVFVSKDNMATFVCPCCEKPVRADVTKYGRLNHTVRIRVKCPCGYRYSVELDRRQHFRTPVNLPGVALRGALDSKKVNIPGVALRRVRGGRSDRVPIVVKDLSPRGVGFRVSKEGVFVEGDLISVEFILDDPARSMIHKDAVVRTADGRNIGAEFTTAETSDPSDRALGFYFLIAGG